MTYGEAAQYREWVNRGREVASLRGEVDCRILSRTLVTKGLLN